MTAIELVLELFELATPKAIADKLQVSLSIVYKWGQPVEGSGAVNPFARVEQLMELTDPELIAQWVCERAGGHFVRDPRKAQVDQSKVVKELAEMIVTITSGSNPKSKWQKVKSLAEGYVRQQQKS